MSGGGKNCVAVGNGFLTTTHDDMAAYDRLPRRLRDRLKVGAVEVAAEWCINAQRAGWDVPRIIKTIDNAEADDIELARTMLWGQSK